TEREGLKDNDVESIFEDKSGNLWIGFLNGGVSMYDGKRFIHFTDEQGLSNNEVITISEDKAGNLWFGTATGLSKLEKNRLDSFNTAITDGTFSGLMRSGSLFKTYVYEDGFSDNSIGFGKTIHEAKDGTIWIGTEERLTAFHPGAETTDTIPPNIQLTGLSLFNEKIAWQNLDKQTDTNIVLGNGMVVHNFHFDTISRWYGVPQHLSLAYNNNYLTFHFVGITLQSPKKVKYQFMLEGFDKRWIALTDRTEAQYGNLPHGKYTFKVKAMNGDGYWQGIALFFYSPTTVVAHVVGLYIVCFIVFGIDLCFVSIPTKQNTHAA
ncbi:MAG TPA: two-component regulator propeller domain-containing protein, partial [Flavitalea sp.]|nr:two-component regulator propeller domain-containing protein [Flavitalea sp.]